VIDPDLVPETWVTGRINVNVTGPVATITFTHVRPDPADTFANKKPPAAVSVVRARIVMPVEGLAGLRAPGDCDRLFRLIATRRSD
jgi:hypothetical protein